MPTPPSLPALAAFALAASVSAVAAQSLVLALEERSAEAVAEELASEGFGWLRVIADGLQVVLEGEAPTEAARFGAMSVAGRVVDGARVIDNMRVTPSEQLAPPAFAMEILRNDSGVSVIGLVPAATDRARLAREIARAADGSPVSDLLQTAEHPVPAGWGPALSYAIDVIGLLDRAKISVEDSRIAVEAVADSPADRRRLEGAITRLKPDGVALALSLSAPRPVIAPFVLRARLEDGTFRFDACSAGSEEERASILAAARAAGAEGPLDCRTGLGAPSPDWGLAAVEGIAALAALGGGTLTLTDADMLVVAPAGIDRDLFEQETGALGGRLPPGFALRAERPDESATPPPPAEFRATRGADGSVRLTGRVADARMAELARSLAQARFGAGAVTLATRTDPAALPEGWGVRVLAGIEALAHLAEGSVAVTPETLAVSGRTGNPAARDEIAAAIIAAVGPRARMDIAVTYDEALDPAAGRPSAEECLSAVQAAASRQKITFDPGSATLSAAARPVLREIAGILRECGDLPLRIIGHTDSQGRESTNLALSQARAEAVLAALRAERVPVAGFAAEGRGAAEPIADNRTEEGREANRRIEFALDAPPPEAVQGPPAPVEEGPPEIVEGAPPVIPPTRPPEDDAG